ncbi:uncharacterized protein LOC144332662 [Macaca mulatta]
MAAGPGAERRAGGLKPAEGGPRFPGSWPALEGFPTRPRFPAPPTRKPAGLEPDADPRPFSLQASNTLSPPNTQPGETVFSPTPTPAPVAFPWALTSRPPKKKKVRPAPPPHPARAQGSSNQSCSRAAGERRASLRGPGASPGGRDRRWSLPARAEVRRGPAASPGLPKAARSSPAAAPGLSSCAPRLPPRLPRGPAPGSSHGPLPRPVAAGLPHVTREQLRPESLGPARGGPSPPPGQGHVAPTRKKAPTPRKRRAEKARPRGAWGPPLAPRLRANSG